MLAEFAKSIGDFFGGSHGYGTARPANFMEAVVSDPTLLLISGAIFALLVYVAFARS